MTEKTEAGFEYQGNFYRWQVSDTGKDLLLIDRISGMGVDRFFEMIEDDDQAVRGSVLLTMIACSIRAGNPTWSVERIMRLVLELSVSEDIVMIDGDPEEEESPLSEGGEQPPASAESPGESSSSPTLAGL